eukprot:8794570-Prorocentrum_lima.AAC.1
MWFAGGTMQPITAPWHGMDPAPGYVARYCSCTWRGEEMTLLEYLRKAEMERGGIHRWVRQ